MRDAGFHEHLLENLTTAVLVLDETLRIRYISPAAQALLELSEQRSIGATLEELLPSSELLLHGLQLEEHSPYTSRGLALKLGSGQELTVDCTLTPLVEEGRDTEVLIELHPVHRFMRINREESLLSSQEISQAMLRGLAHEIKNPLGGLRGAAQLLARELPDPELEDYTRIIIEESDRLRDLVDRLLGPHRQPNLAELNIHEVLEHVRTLMLAEVGSQVSFVQDYDPSLPPVSGDRSQLIQAVLNIVRNAMQATESNAGERIITLATRVQRQFTIGARRHRLVCRIDITDNGPGIPNELSESLFIPMVSGRAEGSGLGLAISQSIITQHQGLIQCASEPGRTTFTLYIPLEHDHA